MPEYLLSTGLLGELGRYRSACDLPRGGRAVVRTPRGLEAGTVLREVTARLAGMMPDTPVGEVVRPLGDEDAPVLRSRDLAAVALVAHAERLGVALLDAEVLFDGARGVLYHAGMHAEALRPIVRELSREYRLTLGTENLGQSPAASGGCGEGGCGDGGCGSGGGCGTCGTTTADDVRDYFAELRGRMETRRVPLL